MQLRLPWSARPRLAPAREVVVAGRAFTIAITRRRGARRYVARVTSDGVIKLTVPHGAALADGLAFVEKQTDWIAREWRRLEEHARPWGDGTLVWFRGGRLPIRLDSGRIQLGAEDVGSADSGTDVRASVTAWMRRAAEAELPGRAGELAAAAGRAVSTISIRNQRSRWGACSTRRTITLNWRLIQVPPSVRDYVIRHELAHLTVPNHSRRFWREVEQLDAGWRAAEHWLKQHEREVF